MKNKFIKKNFSLIILLLNVLLICLAAVFYYNYTLAYEEQSKRDNLKNISNTNQSATLNAMELFDSWNIKLNDMTSYIESNNFTLQEALNLLHGTNSTNERFFELVGSDYKGFAASKDASNKFIPLDYSSYDYKVALQTVFDAATTDKFQNIQFVREFTDGSTALKFFGLYKYVSLEGEEKPWTLMLCVKSKFILEVLNSQNSYKEQSTVVIDKNGDFIVNSSSYPSTNFYTYLKESNSLTLTEVKNVENDVISNQKGEFYYKRTIGSGKETCVFCYEKMLNLSGIDWYCVTCVPLSSYAKPIFNLSYIYIAIGCIIVLFVLDLLWLRNINIKTQELMRREQYANASKSSFLSRMSHEIRTPLNAVIGYNVIAKEQFSKNKSEAEQKQSIMKAMDCLNKSDVASKQLLSIINDVLDMSAIENNKIKIANDRFDFKCLISDLTMVYYSQAKAKGVNFEVIFESVTDEFYVSDQMRLNQILTNLLSNAIKFTPENGRVALKISRIENNEKTARLKFDVIDSGIGMSEAYIAHIWDPFEQADTSISRRFGGTGLGLTISKSLVDLMNGSISVTSVLKQGSCFTVELDMGITEQPKSCKVLDFSKLNILVVDDDVDTCDYIKSLFAQYGVKCHTVNSGQEAVERVKLAVEQNNKYSVCLVDWKMPNMDGVETITKIREIIPKDLPIIVISAYDYAEIVEQAEKLGINKFISKPLFHSSVFDMLADICADFSEINVQSMVKSKDRIHFENARALLVEDNKMNMEIAKNILEFSGIKCDCAWNGKEALDKFNSSSVGYYDIVLMDVHMPVLDGLQATKQIRLSQHSEAKTMPIVAMTADAFVEDIAETKEAGMDDHISKPIDVNLLLSTIKKYIKK